MRRRRRRSTPGPAAGCRRSRPALVEDSVDDALDRLVEWGIVEDDVGGLATEFEVAFLRVPAMARAIILPTAVEPVKAILSMPGWSTIAWPVAPAPVTILTTPGGRSACWQTSAKSEGGQRRGLGRFEGRRCCQWRGRGDLPREHEQREVPRDDLSDNTVRPRVGAERGIPSLSAQPAWWKKWAAAIGTSTSRLSLIGLPLSRVSGRRTRGRVLEEAGDAEEVLPRSAPLSATTRGRMPHGAAVTPRRRPPRSPRRCRRGLLGGRVDRRE